LISAWIKFNRKVRMRMAKHAIWHLVSHVERSGLELRIVCHVTTQVEPLVKQSKWFLESRFASERVCMFHFQNLEMRELKRSQLPSTEDLSRHRVDRCS